MCIYIYTATVVDKTCSKLPFFGHGQGAWANLLDTTLDTWPPLRLEDLLGNLGWKSQNGIECGKVWDLFVFFSDLEFGENSGKKNYLVNCSKIWQIDMDFKLPGWEKKVQFYSML